MKTDTKSGPQPQAVEEKNKNPQQDKKPSSLAGSEIEKNKKKADKVLKS